MPNKVILQYNYSEVKGEFFTVIPRFYAFWKKKIEKLKKFHEKEVIL